MMTRLPSTVIDGVWRALADSTGLARPHAAEIFATRFGHTDLVPRYALLDLIDDFGLRDLAHVDELLDALKIKTVSAYSRPRARGRLVFSGRFATFADAVALVIRLERFGLNVDPKPLVDVLLPRMALKPLLTSAELDCLWFERERHRFTPMLLMADGDAREATVENIRTASGYRIEAWLDKHGEAISLFIRSRRYQRQVAA